jgi:hypothetical protein
MSDQLMKAVNRAVREAKLAYQFSPGSYTFGALNECLSVQDAMRDISWIEEFLDYMELAEVAR